MKYIIVGLFSVALILVAQQGSPEQLNNSTMRPKAEAAALSTAHADTTLLDQDKAEVANQAPVPESTSIVEIEKEIPETVVGCEHYRHLIEQYNWNVDVFLAIAKAESGCNPLAVGDTNPIRGVLAPSCGLFQVRTLSSRPSCEALKDPATNIAWAYRIYQGQGYGAWSVCTAKVECR